MLVSLDRLGSGRAVFVDQEGNAWDVPACALPPDSREGEIFDIRLRKKKGATRKLVNEISRLQQELKDKTIGEE